MQKSSVQAPPGIIRYSLFFIRHLPFAIVQERGLLNEYVRTRGQDRSQRTQERFPGRTGDQKTRGPQGRPPGRSAAGRSKKRAAEPKASERSQASVDGYAWIALSVTTVGALLASIQGSALTIALPNLMGDLQAQFLTIM
jgi:hypothetical protein